MKQMLKAVKQSQRISMQAVQNARLFQKVKKKLNQKKKWDIVNTVNFKLKTGRYKIQNILVVGLNWCLWLMD